MKTQFKLLLFLALLLSGFGAKAQCSSYFTTNVGPGGVVGFYDSTNMNTTCHWDFGDGTTGNDSSFQFTHTYTSSGGYLVCLTDTDHNGCISSHCDSVYVNLCQGASQLGFWQTGFGEYSFYGPNIQGLAGATALWDFGDGSTATTASGTHQYVASGTYLVKLVVAGSGCADSTSVNYAVTLCNYASGYIYDSIGNGPLRSFSVDGPHPGYTYSWNFGDGSNASGDTVTHTYSVSNYYQFCLITADASTGCRDSQCQLTYFDRCGIGQPNISVNSNGLDASFAVNIFQAGNFTYTYLWGFAGGNPSSSVSQSQSVTYSALGTYQASVIVTALGCSDTANASFTLTPPVYSISGTIYKNGAPACGTVYLIRQDTVGHLVLIDSIAELDTLGSCSGNYSFNGLPVDTYFVKAALEPFDVDYANYLPTYHGDVLQWSNAYPIPLLTNSAFTVNINLVAGNNTGGPGFVGGWVSQGAGLVINGHNNGSRAVGDPIAGVQINLLTSTDQAVGYTFTDVNGYYHFSNLSLGSYKIYAEVLNKRATPIPFALTASNPSDSTVSLSINSTGVSGIDEVNAISVNNVYPNPVTNLLNLEIACNSSAVASLKLNDVLGQVAAERQIKLSTGTNLMQLDMSELAPGVYQLIVQSGSKRIAFKVVKTR